MKIALRSTLALMAWILRCHLGCTASAQDSSSALSTWQDNLADHRIGPFDLHPRLTLGMTYDDNILYSTTKPEADAIWMAHPGLQAVAGDDAGLIEYRDQNSDVLDLSPGNLIFRQPDEQIGRVLILDYGPRFQEFDKYTANDSIDQFATFDLLWPQDKLMLGLKQDYQWQRMAIIEAAQRTTVESISTALSAAYPLGGKTSVESDLWRIGTDYAAPSLIGFTEYKTENWFNYNLEQDLPVSLGLMAGADEVANQQDQTYEQVRLRARYLQTDKFTLDASVGGELRQYENGSPATLDPVFNAAGEYRPAPPTSLRLTGYRQQYASILYGYNYASTGAMLEVRQGITDRFTAGVGVGYDSLAYTSISNSSQTHTDGDFTARITFEARMLPHINGQVFCQWVSRQSQFNGNLNDSQVGVDLAWAL